MLGLLILSCASVVHSSDIHDELRFSPGGEYFYSNYLCQHKPLLIRGGSKDWSCMLQWRNISYTPRNTRVQCLQLDEHVSLNEILHKNINCSTRLAHDNQLLKDISLPLVLHCNEFVQNISGIWAHLKSGKEKNGRYSVESCVSPLFHSMEIRLERNEAVIVHPGDIFYIPAHISFTLKSSETLDYIELLVHIFQYKFDENYSEKSVAAYRQFLKQQTTKLECSNRKVSLQQVYDLDLSDENIAKQLRIPRRNPRPEDAVLPSGRKMPVLGLGTAMLFENTKEAVKHALTSGYRLFDLSLAYPGSEVGLAEALQESGIPREDVFIVTKLPPSYFGNVDETVQLSLRNLNTNYIDLYLIHSVECDDFLLKCPDDTPPDSWQKSWQTMEGLRQDGVLRDIGVSNFNASLLRELLSKTREPVAVVQNWFDPLHTDNEVRGLCAQNGIRYMGYSTLGSRWKFLDILDYNPVMESDIITSLAAHYDYVLSHVVLRWAIHKNVTVIPRSSSANHIAQNFRTLDISLHASDIEAMDEIGRWMNEMQQEEEDKEDEVEYG